jgi:hypothetical protein
MSDTVADTSGTAFDVKTNDRTVAEHVEGDIPDQELQRRFDESEDQETWVHALRQNPKAIGWCKSFLSIAADEGTY